ncbi:radical SAM protein [candidate division WOR-3 bacterium]|nr:radical SAM protein [candidate division WOR-3 bacterium]
MNILAVALVDGSQRFVKGYPPKGARLFLQPNVEVMRVAALLEPDDNLQYLDERVASILGCGGCGRRQSLCLVHVGLDAGDSARELAHNWSGSGCTPVFFGPQVTSWHEAAPDWCRPRVVGDVTEVWPQLRGDAEAGHLQPLYHASGRPGYVTPRQVKVSIEMDSSRQTMQFARGCFCPEPVRHLCPEYLYYGTNTFLRTPDEIIGEVISLPRKRIHLLDDDVAALPDYYYELFRRLRNYHRQWVVNASSRLFDHPRLIRLLAKAGTKIIYLNESFLLGQLHRATGSPELVRRLYRRVKSLQASKMLVGARLVLPCKPSIPTDYERIASVLKQLDLDFIEPRFLNPDGSLARVVYRPMLAATEPAWLKNRFYSMETITDRIVRRPRRVGFFTTAAYLVPYSTAYRQSFLEGLAWP